jgi:hypothetical protein
MKPIELDFWEPSPEKPGTSRRICMRFVYDVYQELSQRLTDEFRDTECGFEGLSMSYGWGLSDPDRYREHRWPEMFRWIACYAVTGSNEGHYIHVDLIVPSGTREPATVTPMFLCKTFGGMEHAQKIAAFIANALGA